MWPNKDIVFPLSGVKPKINIVDILKPADEVDPPVVEGKFRT